MAGGDRRWRFRVDAAITGLVLLGLAIGIGVHPSFVMALTIAILAGIVAGGASCSRGNSDRSPERSSS